MLSATKMNEVNNEELKSASRELLGTENTANVDEPLETKNIENVGDNMIIEENNLIILEESIDEYVSLIFMCDMAMIFCFLD